MSLDGRVDPLPAAESSESGPEVPAPRGERVIALDVLRGLAILGTLATNIGFFIWVDQDLAIGETLNFALNFAYGLFTNGYWIGLLTIMFGIGLMIQRQSALRRGDPWLATYPWRAVLLIVEGFLNYLFVVPFDVLMGYGLTALVVCVVLVTPKRVQTVVLALGLVGHVAHHRRSHPGGARLGVRRPPLRRRCHHRGPRHRLRHLDRRRHHVRDHRPHPGAPDGDPHSP